MRLHDALLSRADTAPAPGIARADGLARSIRWSMSRGAFPMNAKVVIHCPAASVTSSVRARTREWVLEFERRSPLFVEPLMGWTGSLDTLSQVRLRFPTREAAIAYAERQGLNYEVREPAHIPSRKPDWHTAVSEGATPSIPSEVAWAWESPYLALHQLLASDSPATSVNGEVNTGDRFMADRDTPGS